MFNTTFAEEKWRALASDTRMKTGFGENLYALQVAIGNLVLQPFRQEAEKLGYETVAAGKNGLWELKDVPIAPFSTRSQAISEAAGPDASKKSRDVAVLDTRQAKAWADPDLLKAEWRRRLTDEKFDIDIYPQSCAPFLWINLSRSGTVCRFWLWRASLRVTGSATTVRFYAALLHLRPVRTFDLNNIRCIF